MRVFVWYLVDVCFMGFVWNVVSCMVFRPLYCILTLFSYVGFCM